MRSGLRRQQRLVRIRLNSFSFICRHGRAPLRGRVNDGACRGSPAIELSDHLGERKVEGSDAVGQSGTDRQLAAIDRGVRPAYGLDIQPAIGGDEYAELRVQLIYVRLDSGPG